jgi:1,4-alpha-glucan branching enzyme
MSTPALDSQTVLELDPWLTEQVPAILHRHELFRKWKDTIIDTEGGYESFMKGYLKMGIVLQPDNSIVYREWAPNAKEAVMIGEFSKAYPFASGSILTSSNRQMEPNLSSHGEKPVRRLGDYGATHSGRRMRDSSRLQSQGSHLVIQRCGIINLLTSLIQISMILPHGARVERIPAWSTRVTQDLSVSPVYEARFWNPPEAERYKFKNGRPPQPRSVRIYEAHVGISTSELRVGTYKEFTRDTLPRIHALGYNVIQLMAVMEHAYYACMYSFCVEAPKLTFIA